MNKLATVMIAAAATCIFAAPGHAQATRTWVAAFGDDVNPCSRTAPCKTFAGAISKTAAGGEINCVDAAGYGAVTITKSMTIDCNWTQGSILATGGVTGVIVNNAAAKVILRGLSINGAGTGNHGVNIVAASQVLIEKCSIFGFVGNAVVMNTAAGVSQISMIDTSVSQVARALLISASGAGVTVATVDNLRAYAYVTSGVETSTNGTLAFVRNSVLTGGTAANAIFTSAGNGTIDLVNSLITGNNIGVRVGAAGSTVKMTGNRFFANNTSTSVIAGGTLATGGDNKVDPIGAVPGVNLPNQ